MASMATHASAASRAILREQRCEWDAVRRRDRAADGAFYYSVLTTGVYCRPICAARLPRRANVSFHATCEEAEAARLPALQALPAERGVLRTGASVVAQACRLIEEAEEAPSLDAARQWPSPA